MRSPATTKILELYPQIFHFFSVMYILYILCCAPTVKILGPQLTNVNSTQRPPPIENIRSIRVHKGGEEMRGLCPNLLGVCRFFFNYSFTQSHYNIDK